MKEIFLKALKTTIPVMMGYLSIGLAYGMLLESKGFPAYYSILISLVVYGGSMQFVMIDLMTSGASLINTALMTVFVHARHLVYGLSMIDEYKDMGAFKPYMIFSLTDETYSLMVNCKESKEYKIMVSFLDQCYWVIGSFLGYVAGSLIAIDTTGIDFAMTALFVIIVVDQFREKEKHIYTYIGFVISIICLIIFGASAFIIPSLIGIIGSLLVIYRRENNVA